MRDRIARFLRQAEIDRPEARAWALYDWANSAMVTTIVTAVFPVYFLKVVARGSNQAQAQAAFAGWTWKALLVIALVAPLLGALADVKGCKKRFLAGFAVLGILAVAAMFFVGQGDWTLALVLFVVANVGAAGSIVFYDSLLPHVARRGRMDQLSTTGYALGYVGGGILLALNIAWITWPGAFGLPSGEGLTPAQLTLPTRLAFLSVAVWWALFTVPLLRRVPEPELQLESDESVRDSGLGKALQRLGETFKELRKFHHAALMLLAFLCYNDGIGTVIRMAAIYAASKELDDAVVIGTILVVQFAGIPFTILAGRLAPRFGAKRLILTGLSVYCAICVFAYFMTSNVHFIVLGLLLATVQGGTQGLSRSLFGAMIPRHKSAEFFAFFASGEKIAGVAGPALFTVMITATGSAQTAILSIIGFFVVGGFLLTRVDVEAGLRAAEASDEDASACQSM